MTTVYDTIVVGSGLAGSITATILARSGFKALLIEKGSHPRMAIGESLLPPTALWFWMIGQRYDIPEITTIAHLDSVTRNIRPSSGVKRGFGYVYHREDQPFNRDEANLLIGPVAPHMRESQFYRQDIDMYLMNAARKYGADYRDNTTIEAVDIDDKGVTVQTTDGDVFKARYIVDAAGFRSVIADQFGLREDPPRQRHHSRTIFTHMRGLRPMEDVLPGAETPGMSASWSHGTLHHVFDGGWFWVIPFNNFEKSKSDLISVGVTVDSRKYPRPENMTPEQEFWQFVNRYPAIAQHFAGAEAVRDYTGTGRIQYSSTRCTGERYALVHHAYGFVDPLYSRGLWRTIESIYALTERLIPALRDDDFSPERFEYLEGMQAAQLDDTDCLVYNAFRAMAHYDTWNAYVRVWLADELMMFLPVFSTSIKYMTSGDPAIIDGLYAEPRFGMNAPYAKDILALEQLADSLFDQVDAGTLTHPAAADQLFTAMRNADWLPHPAYAFGDPTARDADFDPKRMARLMYWGKMRAKREIREQVFDFRLRTLFGTQFKDKVLPGALKRDVMGNITIQKAVVI